MILVFPKDRLSFVSLAPREMPWVIGRALEEKLTTRLPVVIAARVIGVCECTG